MSSQTFKNIIPNKNLFEVLDSICLKNEKYYIFNMDAYKRGIYKETIPKFIESCLPFYHNSKRKYLEKKLTFKSFTTVLRQICKFNKITYTSRIKYDKSTYDIIYYIYY